MHSVSERATAPNLPPCWAQKGILELLNLNTTKGNLSAAFGARLDACSCHRCLAFSSFVLTMVVCLQPQELHVKKPRDNGWWPSWQLQEVFLCVVFSSGKTSCDARFGFFHFCMQSLQPWQAAAAAAAGWTDYAALSLRLLVQMFGAAAQRALKCCMQSHQARKQLDWPGSASLCVVSLPLTCLPKRDCGS